MKQAQTAAAAPFVTHQLLTAKLSAFCLASSAKNCGSVRYAAAPASMLAFCAATCACAWASSASAVRAGSIVPGAGLSDLGAASGTFASDSTREREEQWRKAALE